MLSEQGFIEDQARRTHVPDTRNPSIPEKGPVNKGDIGEL